MVDDPCALCEKPAALCVCAALAPLDNRVSVLILRHPQEQDRLLGTAHIAALQLKNARLVSGLSWPSLAKALGRTADSKRWGVLYLGTAKTAQPLPSRRLTIVDKSGGPLADQDEALAMLEGIILLDGNWQQAKALWWRNPWMLKCQRLILQPPRVSLYGALRKEPRPESISTIEAVAYTLAALDVDNDLAAKILVPFEFLLNKARAQRPVSPVDFRKRVNVKKRRPRA